MADLTTSCSIFHDELFCYLSPGRRSHAPNAKFLHHRFASGKLSFPSSNCVAIERSCKAGLGDGNGSLEELSSKYRRRKGFGRALPNGLENVPIASVREICLEDKRSSTESNEDMEEQKPCGGELGRELFGGETEQEGFPTSSMKISDSRANIEKHDLSVASLRIHSKSDETDGKPTSSSSCRSSQPESILSTSASSSDDSMDESWLVLNGDAFTMAPVLPVTPGYAPYELLQLLSRRLDIPKLASPRATLEQLLKSVMFWKSWGREAAAEEEQRIAPLLEEAAFETRLGVSQLHQWTATELALQHGQLRRVARDVLYLVIACIWVGMVRVAEAVVAAFRSSPPVYSRLWDATHSLDMFTIAWLAFTLRQPIVAILQVDPINLQQVARLRAQMWEHMHKFYERQWKVIATLAMGRMLGLITSTLPSSEAMTKHLKICWDVFLALPLF